MITYEIEHLHFDNEKGVHKNSEKYEENGYWHDMHLANHSAQLMCKFKARLPYVQMSISRIGQIFVAFLMYLTQYRYC